MDRAALGPIALDAVVLDCKNPPALADFYLRLLGWDIHLEGGEEWVDILPPGGGVKLAFQRNEGYVPPVWPEEPAAQQQMAHLDFTVHSLQEMDRAVAHALACGAALAQTQYGGGKWMTLFDPAGHPFCFVLWE